MNKSAKFDALFSAFTHDMFDREPMARALFSVLLKELDIEDFSAKVSREYSNILQNTMEARIDRELDADEFLIPVEPFTD